MLRKLEIICGVLFLAMLLMLGRLMMLAEHSAAKYHRTFFGAVGSGDIDEVTGLLARPLRERVDPPVLSAFTGAIRQHLGAYLGIENAGFEGTTWEERGARIAESSGTDRFEKGTARVELRYRNGEVALFDVRSSAIPVDWFNTPEVDRLCRRRGQEFLEALVAGRRDAAATLMTSSLAASAEWIEPPAGDRSAAASVVWQSTAVDRAAGGLKLVYRITRGQRQAEAAVRFDFAGMQARVAQFDGGGDAWLTER